MLAVLLLAVSGETVADGPRGQPISDATALQITVEHVRRLAGSGRDASGGAIDESWRSAGPADVRIETKGAGFLIVRVQHASRPRMLYVLISDLGEIYDVSFSGNFPGLPSMHRSAFSTDTKGLPEAGDPEVIELSDGDEITLIAAPAAKRFGDRTVRMLAYNGTIPGPIIKVQQHATINVHLVNKTDTEQTLHSHGVRLNNRYDGVAYVTQQPIPVGERFSYVVHFPDAGMYWYHPHMREDYGMELGLYGAYVVEPKAADYWAPVNREVSLLVDDLLLDETGMEPFYREYANFALLGRFGDTFLVNGRTDYELAVGPGEVLRLMLTNASNARTFRLAIPGLVMKRVGADIGRYEQETLVESVLLSPGERVLAEVRFPDAGDYRLRHQMQAIHHDIATFRIRDGSATTSNAQAFGHTRKNADVIREMNELRRVHATRAPDQRLRLTVDIGGALVNHSSHQHMQMMSAMTVGGGAGGAGGALPELLQWDDPSHTDRVNNNRNVRWRIVDEDSGAQNMAIAWRFEVGSMVKVRVTNDPMAKHVMQHPLHFHGQRFVVLARDGVVNTNMVWKDTALILPGESVDLLVEMNNPGRWMAHCHIAEHLQSGMMMRFSVDPGEGGPDAQGHHSAAH